MNSSSQSSHLSNAATAASTAKVLGSAHSSVFSPLFTLSKSALFGTTTAEVFIPAILKHFVGATSVTLLFFASSLTETNGVYALPGIATSQCISSETTTTLLSAQSFAIFCSSSLLHSFPAGFCGLQRMSIVVSGSESFFSRSSKSIEYSPSLYMSSFSTTLLPLFITEV